MKNNKSLVPTNNESLFSEQTLSTLQMTKVYGGSNIICGCNVNVSKCTVNSNSGCTIAPSNKGTVTGTC